jgi:hypothetical protein
MSNAKEITASLRSTLKTNLGLSNKDVSIRKSGYSTVYITVLSVGAFAHLAAIKAIAANHENIHYCQSSGEILSGGNTFVFVRVDNLVKVAVAAPYMNQAIQLFDAVYSLKINQGESLENKDFSLMNDGGRCIGFSGGNTCGNFYSGETLALAFAIANAPSIGGMRKTDNTPSL